MYRSRWNRVEREELLKLENIRQAEDDTLREKILPKTDQHITADQVQTLRVSAERALRNQQRC